VLAYGKWEQETGPIRVHGGGDHVGVWLAGLYVGIEPDGYTHT
jgi:hypothetical protein